MYLASLHVTLDLEPEVAQGDRERVLRALRDKVKQYHSSRVTIRTDDDSAIAIALLDDNLERAKTRLAEIADMLDEALKGKGHVEVDLAILDFTDQRGKQVLSFEPVVFQHTGIYSAANPGRTAEEFEKHWGMQSENFDAENKPIEFSSDRWAKSMPRKNLLISVHNRKTQTVHVPLVSADL